LSYGRMISRVSCIMDNARFVNLSMLFREASGIVFHILYLWESIQPKTVFPSCVIPSKVKNNNKRGI